MLVKNLNDKTKTNKKNTESDDKYYKSQHKKIKTKSKSKKEKFHECQ